MEPEVCQCKYQGVFRYETSFVNIRIIQISTQRFNYNNDLRSSIWNTFQASGSSTEKSQKRLKLIFL